MPKFTGTFVVTRAELTHRVTSTSNGRPVANFWGSCKHTYPALRYNRLDREWLEQDISTTFNFDSLWEEKAETFYEQIMRVAREQGNTTATDTKLVLSFGIKAGKPWQSKGDGGKPKTDDKGQPVWNSSLVLADVEIDEAASLALAQEPDTIDFDFAAEPEFAATPQVESVDVLSTLDW